ncbi:recombinase family protein [Candidatus Falkowbacteria bacterium]|nr:recombinase family protein [Candidatus Falkowbacteria bacterium]
MKASTDKTKYFAYVRKSTEGDERQALSIDSQKDKVKEFFHGLDIVEVLVEKHTAFKPYSRPVFADMIKRISKGEAQGIIAWHPDRLSRNEIDASTITYMVRTGLIKDLKFGSYNFDNSPEGIMMLQMALSQSQYFSSKLGKDVKRGLEKKFEMGWQPNKAPEGYLNKREEIKGLSTIIIDKVNFPLLRRAFDEMLTGRYSVPQVLEKMNSEWGFKTKRIKSWGGRPMARSALYRIFTNPFYAGIINYAGKENKGKHKPMITLEEYDKIQTIMGRDGKPRNQKRDFAYTGLIRCKECGCLVTAHTKHKTIKYTGELRSYTYYFCTHKRLDYSCRQAAITKENLEMQLEKKLEQYQIRPEFLEVGLEIIKELENEEKDKDSAIKINVGKSASVLKEEIKNLTKMRCRNLLGDEEYIESKNELTRELLKLDVPVPSQDIEEKVTKLTKETFDLAIYGRKLLMDGDNEIKKKVLTHLGWNWTLDDKNLEMLAYKWLLPIEKSRTLLNDKIAGLELDKIPVNKRRSELLDSLRPVLRRDRDSNPG